MDNTEFYNRMALPSNKEQMIKLASHCNYILDLGCGRGEVDWAIAKEMGTYTVFDCVDSSVTEFAEDYELSKVVEPYRPNFYNMDLVEFVEKTGHTYDCIILSAVLHELNSEQMRRLAKSLRRIMRENCTLLIREPLFTHNLIKNKSEFKSIFSHLALPLHTYLDWMAAHKKSERRVPSVYQCINMLFTLAYGENSWDREKHEHRFAYSLSYIKRWARSVYKKRVHCLYYRYKDCSYYKHFAAAGLPQQALDQLSYTSGLLVVTNDRHTYQVTKYYEDNSSIRLTS